MSNQGHPRSKGQKGQILKFGFGWCDTCSDFYQECKITIEHFLNGRNRTKFENRENAEILVINVMSGLFGHSKRQNSAVFQDINVKYCTHINRQVLVHIYSVLCSKNFQDNFEEQIS